MVNKYLVCEGCGWKSEPYPEDTLFAGPAGQIGCPVCTREKRNPNIEVYGYVKVVYDRHQHKPVPLLVIEECSVCGERRAVSHIAYGTKHHMEFKTKWVTHSEAVKRGLAKGLWFFHRILPFDKFKQVFKKIRNQKK